MPIKGLTDRQAAFPEIGRVRKGAPKGNNQPGKDLSYFRVEFDEVEVETAALFLDVYKSEPDEINILLPFNSVDENFDAWRETYVAGGLIHRCDGERVWYEVDHKTGECLVTNGDPYKMCDGSRDCKPCGRLKVLIPELRRLAYLTVLTGSIHDIINISQQLEALLQINGKLAGVPLILRRRPREISTPSGSDGKRARRTKYLLSIEADPSWVRHKLASMKAAALPGNGMPTELPALEAPEETDDDWTADAGIGEDTAPDPTEAKFHEVPTPEPAKKSSNPSESETGDRPYSAEKTRERLRIAAANFAKKIEAGQHKELLEKIDTYRGVVAANLEKCFAGDPQAADKRHSVLAYVWEVDSANDLTDGQILAHRKHLAWTQDSGGDWNPDTLAVQEVKAMYRARLAELEGWT